MSIVENTQTEQKVPTQSKVAEHKGKRVLTDAKQPKVADDQLQPIGEGEKATRSTEINGDKVTDTYTFRLFEVDPVTKQKAPRYKKTTVFDFEGCTQEDLINLALQSVRIDWQAQIRSAGTTALQKGQFEKCHVKTDVINKSRDSVDPMVAAARRLIAVLNCSYDEAVAIITKEQQKRAK